MFVNTDSGATAPTVSPAQASVKAAVPAESVRHMLFGTPQVVRATIQRLHHCGYAEPNDWSRTISTGRPYASSSIYIQAIA